jgi:hypothetical protein
MILRQYLRFEPVVTASYLVGCAGKAVGTGHYRAINMGLAGQEQEQAARVSR